MIRGVLLDLSGVLYVGEHLLPGSRAALERLHAAGLPVRYITNTTRSTRPAIVTRLAGMGLRISAEEVFTAPLAARRLIEQRGLRPLLLVHPALEEEFAGLDAGRPDAVLVGDAGERFTYERLNAAFRLVIEGAPLLAMARNRYFKDGESLSLDAGPFVAALEYAAGVDAEVIGKPSRAFFRSAAGDFECDPNEVVVVGDDVEADVVGAVAAGMQAVLVRTGEYRSGDEALLPDGAVLSRDIGDAVNWIIEHKS
ncbi:MAG TPA: TIGR01458 family HAD-type hydrolase [Gammaproteobacteria bacterium]|nr:TIGR01458 family HAD-type hydrolase [Gammaproteobacteria bacterium]